MRYNMPLQSIGYVARLWWPASSSNTPHPKLAGVGWIWWACKNRGWPLPLSIPLRSIRAFSPQHTICSHYHSKHLRRLYKDIKLLGLLFSTCPKQPQSECIVLLSSTTLPFEGRWGAIFSTASLLMILIVSIHNLTRNKAQWLLPIPAVGQKLPGMLHARESSFVCIWWLISRS
jgi:hypothetical protein